VGGEVESVKWEVRALDPMGSQARSVGKNKEGNREFQACAVTDLVEKKEGRKNGGSVKEKQPMWEKDVATREKLCWKGCQKTKRR